MTAQASQSPEEGTGPRPQAVQDEGREEARESALVRDMLAGDEHAMEAFADSYFPGLYRFALARLGGRRELARDIVQTTVCKALAKLESYRGDAPLFSWLCVCCRNEIAMHFRTLKHRPRLVELDESAPGASHGFPGSPPEVSPVGALLAEEQSRRVHEALDHLPSDYARALEWKYLERLSVKEIAGRLRRSAKATESLLSRARGAFRKTYEDLAQSHRSAAIPPNVQPILEGERP